MQRITAISAVIAFLFCSCQRAPLDQRKMEPLFRAMKAFEMALIHGPDLDRRANDLQVELAVTESRVSTPAEKMFLELVTAARLGGMMARSTNSEELRKLTAERLLHADLCYKTAGRYARPDAKYFDYTYGWPQPDEKRLKELELRYEQQKKEREAWEAKQKSRR